MTFGDAVIRVVTEITSESEDKVRQVLTVAFDKAGRYSPFTDDIADADVEGVLSELREDPSSYLSIYAAGKGEFKGF